MKAVKLDEETYNKLWDMKHCCNTIQSIIFGLVAVEHKKQFPKQYDKWGNYCPEKS